MSGILSRLGLRQLVLSLGGLGVLGVVAIATIYFVSNSALTREQAKADIATKLEELVLTLDVELLEARRAEKDFLLRKEERYLSRHDELAKKAGATLQEIEQKLGDGDDLAMRPKLTAMHKGLERYVQQFQRIADSQRKLGFNENSGLEGSLRASVKEVEKQLASLDDKNLTVLMLMMRRHEKDFMLRHDQRYVEQIKQRAGEFAKALGASSLNGPVADGIAKKMAAYQQDFLRFAETFAENVTAAKAVSQAYSEIDPVLDELRGTFARRYKEALAEVAATRSWASTLMLSSLGLVLGCLCFFGLVVVRAITTPIVRLTSATQRLSAGELSVTIEGAKRRDEIGSMARAMQIFKDALIAKKQADEAAVLEADAKMRRAQVLDGLTKRFENNISSLTHGLSSAAAEMEANARTMTETAEQTTSQSVGVASAAEQTSANVQTVAVATEELSSSIREIAEQVAKSSSIAGRAAEEAKRTDATVQALATGAQKIGDVVALINNIAGQTNLLALNATIEAARAGEAGRGFAVVATEVKELASQTAKATEEIASQIGAIQEQTKHAVAAIQTIGSTIGEMNAIAAGVAAAMEEQGAATSEIARNVQQAAQGTQLVTGSILDVKHGAGETGSAATQVLGAAQELARHSDDLGREVNSFLSGVKAA